MTTRELDHASYTARQRARRGEPEPEPWSGSLGIGDIEWKFGGVVEPKEMVPGDALWMHFDDIYPSAELRTAAMKRWSPVVLRREDTREQHRRDRETLLIFASLGRAALSAKVST